ncbi:hypothetical protein Hanom_Chr14g01321381 [Helianthus anomalus]
MPLGYIQYILFLIELYLISMVLLSRFITLCKLWTRPVFRPVIYPILLSLLNNDSLNFKV